MVNIPVYTTKLTNTHPNIKLLGQIPRELVIKRLAVASIGLVIYPNSKWLNDSSPIKIIEYAVINFHQPNWVWSLLN